MLRCCYNVQHFAVLLFGSGIHVCHMVAIGLNLSPSKEKIYIGIYITSRHKETDLSCSHRREYKQAEQGIIGTHQAACKQS